jgi:hypothetical protein
MLLHDWSDQPGGKGCATSRLIAAVDVISPRNKDRPFARTAYLARYLGYLLDGANRVLIDVHRLNRRRRRSPRRS